MAEVGSRLNVWKFLSAAFLVWAIASTVGLAYYYGQFSNLSSRVKATTISVSLIVDYGNGTAYRKSYRDVPAVIGESLFALTVRLASVDYNKQPIGVFVVSIDGVKGNSTHAWLWYRWDPAGKAWVLGEVGADAYMLKDGDVLIWFYTSFVAWPPRPPEPP